MCLLVSECDLPSLLTLPCQTLSPSLGVLMRRWLFLLGLHTLTLSFIHSTFTVMTLSKHSRYKHNGQPLLHTALNLPSRWTETANCLLWLWAMPKQHGGRTCNQKGYPREGIAELDLPGKAEKSARQIREQKEEQEWGTESRAWRHPKAWEGVGKQTLNERRRRTVTTLAS